MRQIQLHDTGAVIQLLYTSESAGDLFHIVNEKDGQTIAAVDLVYEGDGRTPSAQISASHAELIARLPFVMGNEHFLSCVLYSIMSAFSEDHSFYADAFRDDEGNAKSVPLYALGF